MNERKRDEEDKPRFLGLGFSYCLGSVFLDSLIFFLCSSISLSWGWKEKLKLKIKN
jgi:hypothetical protein